MNPITEFLLNVSLKCFGTTIQNTSAENKSYKATTSKTVWLYRNGGDWTIHFHTQD